MKNIQYLAFQQRDSEYYIKCQDQEHSIKDCKIWLRINHLLQYYEQLTSEQESSAIIPIYEYMQNNLNGYDIPNLFEDWHQCKLWHLKNNDDIEWIQKQLKSHCEHDSKQCQIMRRNQRDREKEEFDLNNNEEIDIKNIILNDKLDSIHSFLFHSMQRRRKYARFGDIDDEKKEIPEYDDKKEDKVNKPTSIEYKLKPSVFSNKSISIDQCNVDQIVYILEHDIFNNLKDHKQAIIEYIKEHQIDGNKLIEMKRKKFMNDIAAHLNSNKMKVALGYLYKDLMHFDVMSLYDDIWSNNKPQSIEECNMNQIIFIAENVISDKVTELKNIGHTSASYLFFK